MDVVAREEGPVVRLTRDAEAGGRLDAFSPRSRKIQIDIDAHDVVSRGQHVALTATEFSDLASAVISVTPMNATVSIAACDWRSCDSR